MAQLADEIISILPSLRRYACALTGSKRSGDRYVEVCLEVALERTVRFRSRPDIRREIYKLFQEVIGGFDSLLTDRGNRSLAADRVTLGLLELPLHERALLLLIHMAGFSVDEVAAIMNSSADEVSASLVRAQGKLAVPKAASILVIEDEAIVAVDLADIVYNSGHALLGVATNRARALQLARHERPDLILADVNLGRGESGVATVREIAGDAPLPTIYITGYANPMLAGQTGAFVIPKPFQRETVADTIAEALGALPFPIRAPLRATAGLHPL